MLRLWQLDSLEPQRQLQLHPGSAKIPEIWSVSFSSDGRRLAAAVRSRDNSVNGSVHVWELATGELALPPLEHPNSEAWSAAFSPDGSLIISGDGWCSYLWDALTGELIRGPVRHNGWVADVEFSSDGRFAFCSDFTGGSFFDVQTGLRVGKFFPAQFEVECVTLSPDRSKAVVGGQDGEISIFDVETQQPIGQPIQHRGAVNDVSFSPDGRRVLTASDDGTCRISDAVSGDLLTEVTHLSRMTAEIAQWSADGQQIVTSNDKRIFVWSANREPFGVRTLPHPGVVQALRFTPDGKQLLTASCDTSAWGNLAAIRRWDVETGTPIGSPIALPETAVEIVFNPDGSKAAIVSVDNQALLLDTATGQSLLRPVSLPGTPRNLALHPDETRFATSIKSDARIWSFETGQSVGPAVSYDLDVDGLSVELTLTTTVSHGSFPPTEG